MLELLEIPARVRVLLRASFSAVCPVSKTVDEYAVEIEYGGNGRYVELGSLRRYLDGFRGQEWFHEELCERIWSDLKRLLNVPVRVRLTSEYLGVTVAVEKDG
jgi:NADPH-dependent 7-cyano-7-deazaguanine reductase QueF